MRLLLDTNIILRLVDGAGRDLPPPIVRIMKHSEAELWVSVASIWEVAIKHRLGKLPLPCPLADWPEAIATLGVSVLTVRTAHVIQDIQAPRDRDPFDRLLLAVCAAERMQLVTTDRKLAEHPLAWQPASA